VIALQVEVQALHMKLTPRLRDHAVRRFEFALRRFEERLAVVQVRFDDQNGPRGGEDKVCKVTISGARLGRLRVQGTANDEYAAADLAATRASRGVARRLELRRERREEARRSSPRNRRA
jgi:ribosome-associated translation inhibitor RaiA